MSADANQNDRKIITSKDMFEEDNIGVSPEHEDAEVLGRTFYSLLVSVGVASTWRGGWVILDAGLAPDNRLLSAWLGLLIGVLMFFMLSLLKRSITRIIIKFETQFSMKLVDLIFSYFSVWCCILVWRGVWQLWDHALGDNPEDGQYNKTMEQRAWISHGAGVFLLLLLGGLRSAAGAPTLTLADTIPLLKSSSNPPVSEFITRFCSCESEYRRQRRRQEDETSPDVEVTTRTDPQQP